MFMCSFSFNAIDPEKTSGTLTSKRIKKYFSLTVQNKNLTHDPRRICEAIEGLKIPCNNPVPAACIMTYCADAFEHLDMVGYGDFKLESPKHTIKLISDRLKPAVLKSAMKVEPGLKKVLIFM